MDATGDRHALLLEFDSDSSEFARGFEIGRLWAMLRASSDREIVETVHASNAEMLMRLAEATQRRVRSEDLGNGWLSVAFSEADE